MIDGPVHKYKTESCFGYSSICLKAVHAKQNPNVSFLLLKIGVKSSGTLRTVRFE